MKKKILKWLAIWAVFTLFALVFTSQSALQLQLSPDAPPIWQVFTWQLFSGYVWFALTPLILWLGRIFPINKNTVWQNVPLHLLFGLLITLFQQTIDASVLPKLGYMASFESKPFWEAYKTFLMINIFFCMGIYWVTLGASLIIKFNQKMRERELRTSQLEARLAESRLQVLKFQLQPHFLFNTLNTISELIYKDADSADQMITNLSDLLRLSLEKLEVQEVSLRQELDFLNKYLEIEQMRFHDRLKIEMDVAPETLDATVPNMLLQPLVENAIKHGIAPLAQGGTVKISSERQNGSLLLNVSDNGVGLTEKDPSDLREGVGLKNTRARLQHLYGRHHNFELQSEEHGLTLNLTIPYKAAENLLNAN